MAIIVAIAWSEEEDTHEGGKGGTLAWIAGWRKSQAGFIAMQCPHQGAKNFTRTLLPAVFESQSAFVNSKAPARAKNTDAIKATNFMSVQEDWQVIELRHTLVQPWAKNELDSQRLEPKGSCIPFSTRLY
jgi:hypothetical protein